MELLAKYQSDPELFILKIFNYRTTNPNLNEVTSSSVIHYTDKRLDKLGRTNVFLGQVDNVSSEGEEVIGKVFTNIKTKNRYVVTGIEFNASNSLERIFGSLDAKFPMNFRYHAENDNTVEFTRTAIEFLEKFEIVK